MSDPADKSDDLIAELAKLMAASPGAEKPSVAPMARPAPLDPFAGTPAPPPATPIRIPGMDQPRPVAAAPAAAPPRAPVTGAIRIPGMDNPAPVATSAPVSKFDFGAKPAAAAPIKQEPLSTLTERLAAQNPATRVEPNAGSAAATQPAPVRIPSDLRPVSENRSFAQGPALAVATPTPQPAPGPAAQESNSGDFGFDFGFTRNPPASATPPRPTEVPEGHDPIADLIASSMGDADLNSSTQAEQSPAPAPQQSRPTPAPAGSVAPVIRTAVAPQHAAQKSAITPMGGAPRPANSQPIPLKPVSVAPRAPEADRFATSPGAGLNIRPQQSQPLNAPVQRAPETPRSAFEHSDPMSEIESLIGDAVRVELAPPGAVRVQAVQQKVAPHVAIEPGLDIDGDGTPDTALASRSSQPGPAPVVPPLTTNFAPRRAGLKDDAGQASAEDAILAAAAATGAQVDRVDPNMRDESPYRRLKVKPARSSFASGGIRQYVGMAVAGTLLLAAGLGLYWVLNMGRANTIATGDNAPQLTADATPVKVAPTTPAVAETDATRSPVLEQMAGTSVEPSAEQLVSTDETATAPVTRDVTNTAAADDTEGGLANRKVRTVTVRPDGTIVSGDDAVAGTEALPVDRPNVPEMPATDSTNLLGDTTSVAMTDPATENTALSATPAPLTADTSAAPTQTAEAAISAIPNAGGVAPMPINFPVRSETVTAFVDDTPATPTGELTGAQTPTGQIDLLGGEIQVATAKPAVAATPVDTGSAVAYVQLSSSPSQADAEASLRSLNNRFGSLFGGSKLIVQSADLGQKGTWYRVKLPAASLGDAGQVCAQVKANGGDCIVTGG